jgi:hypothetical protein
LSFDFLSPPPLFERPPLITRLPPPSLPLPLFMPPSPPPLLLLAWPSQFTLLLLLLFTV